MLNNEAEPKYFKKNVLLFNFKNTDDFRNHLYLYGDAKWIPSEIIYQMKTFHICLDWRRDSDYRLIS